MNLSERIIPKRITEKTRRTAEKNKDKQMNNWNGIGSLLIASIEFIILINLVIFAGKNKFNKLAMILVLILMTYQLLEFLMCQVGLSSSLMAYFAFAVISLLPPFNFILVAELYNFKSKAIALIFLPATAFILYYLFVIDQFTVTSCAVLYATYNYPFGDLYGLFYYAPVVAVIVLLVLGIKKGKDKKTLFISKVLLAGNIIISIPTAIAFILIATGDYYLIIKIESIMCKFAFVYALCLSIVCLYNSKRKYERNNTEHLPGD
ncbi:MAG: hypothetical protein DRQ01_08800 [Ignavibacteriae bacterium]|nr:MAG: hypothetical protein DRQ01_08800 [Ignavibacteriota bacterium]